MQRRWGMWSMVLNEELIYAYNKVGNIFSIHCDNLFIKKCPIFLLLHFSFFDIDWVFMCSFNSRRIQNAFKKLLGCILLFCGEYNLLKLACETSILSGSSFLCFHCFVFTFCFLVESKLAQIVDPIRIEYLSSRYSYSTSNIHKKWNTSAHLSMLLLYTSFFAKCFLTVSRYITAAVWRFHFYSKLLDNAVIYDF